VTNLVRAPRRAALTRTSDPLPAHLRRDLLGLDRATVAAGAGRPGSTHRGEARTRASGRLPHGRASW